MPTDDLIVELSGVVIDQIAWDGTWGFVSGASLAFANTAGGDQTINDLPADWVASNLAYGDGDLGSPGVPNFNLLLSENFDTWPLTGWTIEDGDGTGSPDGITWAECTSGLTGGTGSVACVDSDAAGSGVTMLEGLVLPSFDASGGGTVILTYTHYYNWYSSDQGVVEVSVNGVWTLFVSDDAGFDTGTLEQWGLLLSF